MSKLSVSGFFGGLQDEDGELTSSTLVLRVLNAKGTPVSGVLKNHIQVWEIGCMFAALTVGACTDLSSVFPELKGIYSVPLDTGTGFAKGHFVFAVRVRMPVDPKTHKTVEGFALIPLMKAV